MSSRKKAEAVSLLLQVNQGGKQQKATFADSWNACSGSIAVSMVTLPVLHSKAARGGGEVERLRLLEANSFVRSHRNLQ